MNNKVTYQCPSNIALVKYWGKKSGGPQLPANPSISLTLADLCATTTVEIAYGNVSGKPSFQFMLEGQIKKSFEPKIEQFLTKIWEHSQLVQNQTLVIQSQNNFPHGTGIASSAAGFGALACCIADLEFELYGAYPAGFDNFEKAASFLARLGSGSACRSLYAKPAIWGEHPDFNSSDLFAVPLDADIDPIFSTFRDAVLIVDSGEKSVSSTAGHALLTGNAYAESRYKVANQNLGNIVEAMKSGKMHSFINIVESEALQLHAMMMASSPYYLLMRPGTVAIIEKIWAYREKTGHPLMFTLDAGANVHLLYPENIHTEAMNFIETELLVFCENKQYLCTRTGTAPKKC